MERLKVKLSDWMYEVMLNNEVLTLNCDYFLISSPLKKEFTNYTVRIAKTKKAIY